MKDNSFMFYHVSKKNLGNTIYLEPKIPESSLLEEEGNIPRICVSINVYYCLRSIIAVQAKNFHVFNLLEAFRHNLLPMESKEYWVARGENLLSPSIYISKKYAFLPPNSSDFRSNKEHWYLQKTKFERLGFLDLSALITNGKLNVINDFNQIDGFHVLNEKYKQLKVRK